MLVIDRFYRDFTSTKRWDSFRVRVKTTDLYIRCKGNFSSFVKREVVRLRRDVEVEIKRFPEFLTSFEPLNQPCKNVPLVVSMMYESAKKANVGPMAAVAGAIAHIVGEKLSKKSAEVIVENGGDVYIAVEKDVKLTVFAGNSPFSGKIGIKVPAQISPVGVCTSSGKVGHSMSFGRADAFCVISKDTALADAVATGGANIIKTKDDIKRAIEYASSIDGVIGVLAIYKDSIGAWGNIELCEI